MSLAEAPSVRPTEREPRHRLDAAEVVEDLRVRKDAADGFEPLLRKAAAREVYPDHLRKGAAGEVLLEQGTWAATRHTIALAGIFERCREPRRLREARGGLNRRA